MGLAFRESGNPTGPAVLFLHGFMGSATDWTDVISALGNYRCIAIDLPGHGETASRDFPGSWDMASTAAECINVLKRLSIEKCILVGYSMGGRLGLYMAVNHPQWFSGVILESASPGFSAAAERKQRIHLDEARAARIEEIGLTAFLQEWYHMPLFAKTLSEKQIAILCERRKENFSSALTRSLREMGTGGQPPLWNELSEIKLPLFLFIGEKDGKFRDIAERMRKVSHADIVILNDCGHNCHFEKPQLYVRHLQKILKSIS